MKGNMNGNMNGNSSGHFLPYRGKTTISIGYQEDLIRSWVLRTGRAPLRPAAIGHIIWSALLDHRARDLLSSRIAPSLHRQEDSWPRRWKNSASGSRVNSRKNSRPCARSSPTRSSSVPSVVASPSARNGSANRSSSRSAAYLAGNE